jgi:hypothetical protein
MRRLLSCLPVGRWRVRRLHFSDRLRMTRLSVEQMTDVRCSGDYFRRNLVIEVSFLVRLSEWIFLKAPFCTSYTSQSHRTAKVSKIFFEDPSPRAGRLWIADSENWDHAGG